MQQNIRILVVYLDTTVWTALTHDMSTDEGRLLCVCGVDREM